jgi:hypothetical protein
MTDKSDEEVLELGCYVTEFLKEEGGYDGLYRNCQHFLVCLMSYLCPGVKLPTRADEICGGILLFLNPSVKNMKKRIKEARKYCDQRLAEKTQARIPGSFDKTNEKNLEEMPEPSVNSDKNEEDLEKKGS